MPTRNLFKLEKLKIKAYKFRNRGASGYIGTFEAMFNPETFSQKYAILYGKNQGINSSKKPVKYARSEPSGLSLKLILDGTGVHELGFASFRPTKTVAARVSNFLDLAFRMNGDIHEPNYLKVLWGELAFNCRLGSVDVNYSNFDRDGTPLRASLDVNLIADETVDDLQKTERKSSPDLSHIRIVKAGDTLTLLAKEIYGSPLHHLWVARANGLDEIRRLTPGQRLIFPPLETAGEN